MPDAPVGVPNDITEHFKLMFDLMALAFQADITRIITLSMDREASMRTYTNLGIAEAFHPLSHHGNNPEKQAKLVQIQRYHTEVFAKFVERLSKAQEAGGTVLDHSTILFGSNMSNSDKHNNDPLPSAILGHANGKIKGGQHMKYPQDSRFADLLVTIFDRNNIPVEKIGDSGGILRDLKVSACADFRRRASRRRSSRAVSAIAGRGGRRARPARGRRARRSRGRPGACWPRAPTRTRRARRHHADHVGGGQRRRRAGARAGQGRRRTSRRRTSFGTSAHHRGRHPRLGADHRRAAEGGRRSQLRRTPKARRR